MHREKRAGSLSGLGRGGGPGRPGARAPAENPDG